VHLFGFIIRISFYC